MIDKCPKCGGEIEKGHVGSAVYSTWPYWVKEGKRTKIGCPKVLYYSCSKCGYIESYVDRK